MTSPQVSVVFSLLPFGSEGYHSAVQLREDILRKPLGLTFSPEDLAKEKGHLHVGGFWGAELVATTALVPQGQAIKMQRVAVKQEFQRQGIASAMVIFCEDFARQKGFSEMYCHARGTAVQFYLKNKYTPVGEYFMETTIPHIKMRKTL